MIRASTVRPNIEYSVVDGPTEQAKRIEQVSGLVGEVLMDQSQPEAKAVVMCESNPEIKAIVEGGLARAQHLLTEHVDQLHLLAGALLEYETLSGDEIKKLIAGEQLDRSDPGSKTPSVPAAGTSIPKTRRPTGFGNPTPLGA